MPGRAWRPRPGVPPVFFKLIHGLGVLVFRERADDLGGGVQAIPDQAMHGAVRRFDTVPVFHPCADFRKAAEALFRVQAGIQLLDHRPGNDSQMPSALVVHPQKTMQPMLLIPPCPCRDGRQALAKQRRQLASGSRQPRLLPIQELQPFLFPLVIFPIQQIGEIFFRFNDINIHYLIG